jgi:hypothetical protein
MRFSFPLIALALLILFSPFSSAEAAICTYTMPVVGPPDPNNPNAVIQGCQPLLSSTVNPTAQEEECTRACTNNELNGWTGCTVSQALVCPDNTRVSDPRATTTKLIIIPLDNPLGSENNAAITEILPGLLGRLISNALGFVGTLTLLVFIYGGFLWLTSAGNEEKVSKGTHAMAYAAIGICIIFSSYAILSIVFQAIGGG